MTCAATTEHGAPCHRRAHWPREQPRWCLTHALAGQRRDAAARTQERTTMRNATDHAIEATLVAGTADARRQRELAAQQALAALLEHGAALVEEGCRALTPLDRAALDYCRAVAAERMAQPGTGLVVSATGATYRAERIDSGWRLIRGGRPWCAVQSERDVAHVLLRDVLASEELAARLSYDYARDHAQALARASWWTTTAAVRGWVTKHA